MGAALAQAAIESGHEVVIVSGPVDIEYPTPARVIDVVSTEEMLQAAQQAFESCDGAIGVAAPCDYRPVRVSTEKISKTGDPLLVHLVETVDVIAAIGADKGERWVVGFALETEDHRFRAITKAEKKSCDLMVLNSPAAMNAEGTEVEVLNPNGDVIAQLAGAKTEVSRQIFYVIEHNLIDASLK